MNKALQLLTFMLLISATIFAQAGKLRKADKLFARYNYTDAAKIYEKLVTKVEYAMPASKKLAQSYKQLGQYKKASQWYQKAIELDAKIDPEFVYEYALMLRSNENYEESAKWMAKFHQLKAGDSRGAEYSNNTNFVTKQRSKPVRFSIKNLDINTTYSDFGSTYYGTDKAIFTSARADVGAIKRTYVWNNQPFLNLYKSKRDKGTGDLSDVVIWDKKLNSKFHDGPGAFTPDLKRLYFTRNNYFKKKARKSKEGINKLKIYFSELKDTNYVNVQELSVNNNEYSVGHPCVSPDGKKLYFASDMPGGIGGTDIWMADIAADGNIGKPVNMGNVINTEGNEMFPYVHRNGMLFFASNGHVGFGGLDIFVSLGKDGNYKKVENVGAPVNGPMDDFAFIMNEFQTQGYFSSNREGGHGDDDIYSFQLLRPFDKGLIVKGTATDKNTHAVLPGTKVRLLDVDGLALKDTVADANGKYEFEVEEELDYKMKGTLDNFSDGNNTFTTKNLDGKKEVTCDLELEQPGFNLYGIVTDRKTKAAIETVSVIITDETGKEVINTMTPATGDFSKILSDAKLNDKLDYTIKLVKPGYFPKTLKFSKVLTTPGQVSLHTELDLAMDKMESGTDLMKAFNIEPIYFDLDKFFIRKDAATTLDKIVQILKEYPTMELDLGSHTDCRETKGYNRTLSTNRYKSTKQYLASRTKNGNKRMSGKGYGETQLVNDCPCEPDNKSGCSEEQHQMNRRTEFKIRKL